MHLAGGHQEGAIAVEADDFGLYRRAAIAMHFAHGPDRGAYAGGLENQARDAHQRGLCGGSLARR